MEHTELKEQMKRLMQILNDTGLRWERVLVEVYTFGILYQQENDAQAENAAPKRRSEMILHSAETLLEILQERRKEIEVIASQRSSHKTDTG